MPQSSAARAAGEGEQGRGEQIDALIAEISHGLHLLRFFAQHPGCHAGGVAAQVIQRAAEGIAAHADIFRLVRSCDKGGFQIEHIADRSAFQLGLYRRYKGRMQIGEGFHEMHAVFAGAADHGFYLLRGGGERLFAQHMLFGVERLHRPLAVQFVGQRNVHRFHFGIGQQLVIAAIGLFKAEALPELLRFFY